MYALVLVVHASVETALLCPSAVPNIWYIERAALTRGGFLGLALSLPVACSACGLLTWCAVCWHDFGDTDSSCARLGSIRRVLHCRSDFCTRRAGSNPRHTKPEVGQSRRNGACKFIGKNLSGVLCEAAATAYHSPASPSLSLRVR